MKRILCIVLLLSLTACGAKTTGQTPLETASETYTLEQAKAEYCVVFEDSVITAGQEQWDSFLENAQSGKPAEVRLVDYDTLDKERCSPEYYEAEKDNYPKLFTQDLSYDGTGYTVRYYDEGKEYTETYQYLKRFDEMPRTSTPEYRLVIYMLLNDETATFSEYMAAMASSDSRTERVDGTVVYFSLVYDKVLRNGDYAIAGEEVLNLSFDMARNIFFLHYSPSSSVGTTGAFSIENADAIRCISYQWNSTYSFRIVDNDTIVYVQDGSDELYTENGTVVADGTEFKRTVE